MANPFFSSRIPHHFFHIVGYFIYNTNFVITWTNWKFPSGLLTSLLQSCVLLIILGGCGAMNVMPEPEQPTAIQQFLMAQAVERSLRGDYVMPVSLVYGDTVVLDASTLTVEQRFFKGALGGWLGEKGLNVVTDSDDAKYRAIVLVQSLGTEQSTSFFGLPPIESVLLPFALPEISVFKAQYQTGYTRFRMDFFENKSGKFIRSTPWFQGSTYFNEYTVLFFFDFQFTDLVAPL
jgi:hypothetical protein